MRTWMRVVVVVAVALLAGRVAWAEGDGEAKAKLPSFGGKIASIETDSLTVEAKGDGGGTSLTFKTDAGTKVLVPTGETEDVAGEGGKTRTRPKMAEGKLADLKVGDRVSVLYNADNVATQITVAPAPAPKKGREGE